MSLLEDVAREFVTIDRDLCGATGARARDLAIHSLSLRHDLNLLCDIPCDCDEGTCPGLITRANFPTADTVYCPRCEKFVPKPHDQSAAAHPLQFNNDNSPGGRLAPDAPGGLPPEVVDAMNRARPVSGDYGHDAPGAT